MEGMGVRDYNGQSDSEVGEQQIGLTPWCRNHSERLPTNFLCVCVCGVGRLYATLRADE